MEPNPYEAPKENSKETLPTEPITFFGLRFAEWLVLAIVAAVLVFIFWPAFFAGEVRE